MSHLIIAVFRLFVSFCCVFIAVSLDLWPFTKMAEYANICEDFFFFFLV